MACTVFESVLSELEQNVQSLAAKEWNRPLSEFIDPINTVLALLRILTSAHLTQEEKRHVVERLRPLLQLEIGWSCVAPFLTQMVEQMGDTHEE
jgi:hypothetical protein